MQEKQVVISIKKKCRADFIKRMFTVKPHTVLEGVGIKPVNKEAKPGYLEIKRNQIRL